MAPKRKRRSTRSHTDYEVDTSEDDEILQKPNSIDSGGSDSESDSKQLNDDHDNSDDIDYILSQYSYKKVFSSYVEDQTKLEKDHTYVWVDGEKKYDNNLENLCFLSDSQKRTISNYSHVELFEQFFSDNMKNYIVQATNENGYALTLGDLNTFIGILILSTFNKSQKDYWSLDPLLSCDIIRSSMRRDTFIEIKSKIKYSKATDENKDDKAWRTRILLNKFR